MIKTMVVTFDDKDMEPGTLRLEDLREIVRCKDCEFSMFDKECSRIDQWEDETWVAIEPDGFGALGKRMKEDE